MLTLSDINRILVGFLFLALTIQALPLFNLVGTIGQSPVFILVPVLFAIQILQRKTSIKSYFWGLWGKYLLFTFATSFITLLYLFLFKDIIFAYNQNLFSKLIKNSYYIVTYTLSYFVFFNIIKDNYIIGKSKFFQITFLFLVFIGAIEFINPTFFDFMQFNREYNHNRLRLLSSEPSNAQFIFSITFFLAIWETLKNSNTVRLKAFIYLTLFIILSIFIGSKGGLVFILISLAVVAVNFKEKSIKRNLMLLFLYLPIVLLTGIFITLKFVIPSLLSDFESFNSISTRLATSTASIQVLYKYPMGLGYGTYLYYFPTILSDASNFLSGSGLIGNTTEIGALIGTGENLTAKSGVLGQVLYNGWSAIIFFFLLFRHSFQLIGTMKASSIYEKRIFKALLIYIALSVTISVNTETTYIFLIPLVILEILNLKKNENISY